MCGAQQSNAPVAASCTEIPCSSMVPPQIGLVPKLVPKCPPTSRPVPSGVRATLSTLPGVPCFQSFVPVVPLVRLNAMSKFGPAPHPRYTAVRDVVTSQHVIGLGMNPGSGTQAFSVPSGLSRATDCRAWPLTVAKWPLTKMVDPSAEYASVRTVLSADGVQVGSAIPVDASSAASRVTDRAPTFLKAPPMKIREPPASGRIV